ncbi:MAG: hypothetical protein KBS63_03645 [Clostridiales bacterium]|nr:hypothetical protein [Candidatus Crickella caballi]
MLSAFSAYNAYTGGDTSMIQMIAVVAMYVGLWKVFEKAGTEGWRGIIPIYNYYKIFELTAGNGWLFLICCIPVVGNVFMGYCVAKAFGKSQGFMIGLMILPFIFIPMLGFDDSRYYGPMGVSDSRTTEARSASTVSFDVKKNTPDESTVSFDVEEADDVEEVKPVEVETVEEIKPVDAEPVKSEPVEDVNVFEVEEIKTVDAETIKNEPDEEVKVIELEEINNDAE